MKPTIPSSQGIPSSQLAAKKSSVFIETFGCQMNILDSELVASGLTNGGYQLVANPNQADIVLYNTCSVRALSEHKVLSRIGVIKKRKDAGENIVLGVLGCMAERVNKTILTKNSPIDLLVGPNHLSQIPALLDELTAQTKDQRKTKVLLSGFVNRKGSARNKDLSESLSALDSSRPTYNVHASRQAFVRITRGCNKFCSFCVVPRTRGPEIHRSPIEIVDEVRRLVDGGSLEITLLGQTINHYEFNSGGKRTTFAELLFRIHEDVPHLQRLRFLTSHAQRFDPKVLDVMALCKRICKYLHIPAQSGSDRILKMMNRGYNLNTYLELIDLAREVMPNLSIIGDMIVGFPSETDADFDLSLDLIRRVKYKNVFVFKYSTRPNTVAAKKFPDDISDSIKRERNNVMLGLQKEISLIMHQKLIGATLEVIVEGKAKINPNENELVQLGKSNQNQTRLTSRTTGDHIVAFDGPRHLIGRLVKVNITSATSLAMTGKLIS